MITNHKQKFLSQIDVLFIIILLFNDSFFYLFSSANTTIVASIISVFLFFISLFKRHKIGCFSPMILLILVIQISSVFFSSFYYGQGLVSGFGNINRYFIYLSYFYFYPYYSCTNNQHRMLKIISNIALFVSIICLIQSAIYPNFIFFKNYSIRDGQIRLYGISSAILIGIMYSCVDFLFHPNLKRFLKVFLIYIYIIFCNQGRGAMLIFTVALFLVCFVSYFYFNKKGKSLRKLLSVPTLALVSVLFFFLFNKTFASFSTELYEGGSTATRYNEIIYYFGLLKKTPLFGIGNLSGEIADNVYGITEKWFYIEDTGLLSIVFKNGLLGIIWLIVYFLFLVKKDVFFYREGQNYLFLLLLFYLVINFLGFTFANEISSRGSVFLNMFLLIVFSKGEKYNLSRKEHDFNYYSDLSKSK